MGTFLNQPILRHKKNFGRPRAKRVQYKGFSIIWDDPSFYCDKNTYEVMSPDGDVEGYLTEAEVNTLIDYYKEK